MLNDYFNSNFSDFAERQLFKYLMTLLIVNFQTLTKVHIQVFNDYSYSKFPDRV